MFQGEIFLIFSTTHRTSLLTPISLSLTAMPSNTGRESPLVFAPNVESEEWIKEWETVQAKGAWIPSSVVKFGANFEPRDLVDGPLIAIDGEISVDDACAVSCCTQRAKEDCS